MNLPHLREQFQREHEWPFSHENKWMAIQCIPKYNPVRDRRHGFERTLIFLLFILERNTRVPKRSDRTGVENIQTVFLPGINAASD
jgi:hypothetical protein